MSELPALSNASFISVRTLGVARAIVGDYDRKLLIQDCGGENFEALKHNFTFFVGRLRDAFSGNNVKRSLREAHEFFDVGVLPALRLMNIEIVDAKDYSDSSVTVSSDGSSQVNCCDAQMSLAKIVLRIPLRRGLRKLWNNSSYDAHARLEEMLHLFQFLNEAPLTLMGQKVEKALLDRDNKLLFCLSQRWDSPERRRRFVRENDIMSAYDEFGIALPGIFLFPYDRRGVYEYIQKLRNVDGG